LFSDTVGHLSSLSLQGLARDRPASIDEYAVVDAPSHVLLRTSSFQQAVNLGEDVGMPMSMSMGSEGSPPRLDQARFWR
jgi:hypothetical protein